MPKNLVYFGSPEFSAQILESLLSNPEIKVGGVACPPDYRVVGVVSQPDKPVGRKQILTPSPVADLADRHELPVYKPTKLDNDHLAHIKLLKPDIFLVASYGLFMPPKWLSTPTLGTFNLHFSLLPKYRGALCIQEAIKNQDQETGVTLMVMDQKMDHGPIVDQLKVDIDPNDNVTTLTTKLTQAGIEILKRNLPEICAQNYTSTPQDETLATFTPSLKTLTRENAFIPWDQIATCLNPTTMYHVPCTIIHKLICSLNPQPGAWTIFDPSSLRVSGIPEPKQSHKPIELKILKTKVTGNKFEILEVQLPGKSPISWKQFLAGHYQNSK